MLSLTCACGKKYQVPERLAGKRVKCKQCSRPIEVPAVRSEPQTFEALMVDEEAEKPHVVVDSTPGSAVSGGRTPRVSAKVAVGGLGAAMGNYLKDGIRSFAFFAEPGNLIAFLVVGAIAAIKPVLGSAAICCWMYIAYLIVEGWILSFLFNVMLNAAGGSRELGD